MMYITVKEAAEKWGISDRRVRILCSEGKIPGTYQEGRTWKIPYDAIKPTDGRYKAKESLIPMIEYKLEILRKRRPPSYVSSTRTSRDSREVNSLMIFSPLISEFS